MQKENGKDVIKQRRHSKLDLESSTQVVSQDKQQAWKTLNQVQGDNTDLHNGGFTLIELLVVVLIIGILAAVAVPQYQKAVEKARAVQAIAVVKAMGDAQEAYYLASNAYATEFDELSIEVPGEDYVYTPTGKNHKKTDRFDFYLYGSISSTIAGATNWDKDKVGNSAYAHYYIIRLANDPAVYCQIHGDNDTYNVCKSLSRGQTTTVSGKTLYIVN